MLSLNSLLIRSSRSLSGKRNSGTYLAMRVIVNTCSTGMGRVGVERMDAPRHAHRLWKRSLVELSKAKGVTIYTKLYSGRRTSAYAVRGRSRQPCRGESQLVEDQADYCTHTTVGLYRKPFGRIAENTSPHWISQHCFGLPQQDQLLWPGV